VVPTDSPLRCLPTHSALIVIIQQIKIQKHKKALPKQHTQFLRDALRIADQFYRTFSGYQSDFLVCEDDPVYQNHTFSPQPIRGIIFSSAVSQISKDSHLNERGIAERQVIISHVVRG
jgi:hypothetical protein